MVELIKGKEYIYSSRDGRSVPVTFMYNTVNGGLFRMQGATLHILYSQVKDKIREKS